MKRFVLATLVIASAGALSAGTAIAQSAPPASTPSVPAALETINSTLNAQTATINGLAKQIAQLTNTIGTPPPAQTVMSTGLVNANGNQVLMCAVENIGTAPVTVTITGQVEHAPITLTPNSGQGLSEQLVFDSFVSCRFSSPTGVAQLRGTLQISATANSTPLVALTAR